MTAEIFVYSVDVLVPKDNSKLETMHHDAMNLSSFLHIKTKHQIKYSEPSKICVLFTDEKDAMWFRLKYDNQ